MPNRTVVVLLMALAVVVLYVRRRPPPMIDAVAAEKEIVLPPPPEPTAVATPAPVPAPMLSEVQPALDRVFGEILTVDRANQPPFVAGDFNGDDVADLAVAVRPRKNALPAVNAELAGWRLQDAIEPPAATASEPARVAAGERLLAVVHGVDADGWRHADARQCYLVKNAVGMRMHPQRLAGMPSAVRLRAIRLHTGDVIVQDRGGKRGLIFWTGAAYTWAALELEQNPLIVDVDTSDSVSRRESNP